MRRLDARQHGLKKTHPGQCIEGDAPVVWRSKEVFAHCVTLALQRLHQCQPDGVYGGIVHRDANYTSQPAKIMGADQGIAVVLPPSQATGQRQSS